MFSRKTEEIIYNFNMLSNEEKKDFTEIKFLSTYNIFSWILNSFLGVNGCTIEDYNVSIYTALKINHNRIFAIKYKNVKYTDYEVNLLSRVYGYDFVYSAFTPAELDKVYGYSKVYEFGKPKVEDSRFIFKDGYYILNSNYGINEDVDILYKYIYYVNVIQPNLQLTQNLSILTSYYKQSTNPFLSYLNADQYNNIITLKNKFMDIEDNVLKFIEVKVYYTDTEISLQSLKNVKIIDVYEKITCEFNITLDDIIQVLNISKNDTIIDFLYLDKSPIINKVKTRKIKDILCNRKVNWFFIQPHNKCSIIEYFSKEHGHNVNVCILNNSYYVINNKIFYKKPITQIHTNKYIYNIVSTDDYYEEFSMFNTNYITLFEYFIESLGVYTNKELYKNLIVYEEQQLNNLNLLDLYETYKNSIYNYFMFHINPHYIIDLDEIINIRNIFKNIDLLYKIFIFILEEINEYNYTYEILYSPMDLLINRKYLIQYSGIDNIKQTSCSNKSNINIKQTSIPLDNNYIFSQTDLFKLSNNILYKVNYNINNMELDKSIEKFIMYFIEILFNYASFNYYYIDDKYIGYFMYN